jgi:hypothetical protein
MQLSTKTNQLLALCLLSSNSLSLDILDESNAGSNRYSDGPQKADCNTEAGFPLIRVDLLISEKSKRY